MKIKMMSLLVEDQDKALRFYTEVLGFKKKHDIPLGKFKWLTVLAPEGTQDVELVLEPNDFPPAKTYQKALFDAGIPQAVFGVEDIEKEYERLGKLGVKFRGKPSKAGPVTVVRFEDTCGNLIQLLQA